MKKQALLIVIFSLVILSVFAQEKEINSTFKPKGKAIVRVFANYNSNLGGNEQAGAVDEMEIKRAYLGYKSTLNENYSIKLTMDVGNSSGKYSTYLKIAELKYKKDNITAHIGMIATKQFKVQEGFWGYRYLLKSFQDEYKYNGSADLGLSVDYKINKIISVDAIVQNGEGYKHVDATGTYRGGLGTTINFKPITFRLYYDISSKPDVQRQNISTFIGYKFKKSFRIAGEYNYQLNNAFVEDHNMFGFSVYTTYIINKKFEVFARYDKSQSNIIEDANASPNMDAQAWNVNKDEGSGIIGLQYKPLKTVKISANYRRTLSAIEDAECLGWLFLNLEFKL